MKDFNLTKSCSGVYLNVLKSTNVIKYYKVIVEQNGILQVMVGTLQVV